MPRVQFAVGDLIQTRVAKPCWYSDYGLYPDYTIETGETGTVVSIGIAPVRGHRNTDLSKVQFGFVQLKDSDRYGEICQSYFPEEIKRVDRMAPDVVPYMMTRYQTFHFRCPICRKFFYAQLSKLYNAQGTVVDYVHLDKSGKTYGLASVRYLKACCGETLQARAVKGSYDPYRVCGKACYDAKTRDCTCACAGTLHGVSYATQW